MTFEQYSTLFLRRWYLVLICTLLAGLGALLVGLFLVPVYQSTALVQVVVHSGNNQGDINELLASNQLVQTETMLATSDPVLRDVASRYPALSVVQLSGMVSASPRLNTQLFAIAVQDTSALRAARLANDIAATLLRQQQGAWQSEDASSQQQLQQDLGTTGQQIDNLKSRLNALQRRKVKDTTQSDLLNGQLTTLQQHYSQWQQALAQLELSEAQSNNFLHIDQLARPATTALRPDVSLYALLGLLGGLLLGSLLIIVWAKLDKRIRTADDLHLSVPWPVLATLRRSTPPALPLHAASLNAQSLNGEAYRLLRSSLGFVEVDKPLRYLMVTSTQTGDGKSTVAAHLACYMAKAGKRTLLIDANLRQPSLHQFFDLPTIKRGLSNAILACGSPQLAAMTSSRPVLSSLTAPFVSAGHTGPTGLTGLTGPTISLQDYIHSVGIANLGIMPSGPLPPNPSELLDSRAMQRFFRSLECCSVDIVIFDAPPILDLSDACILAPNVDGLLLVVDVQRTHRPALDRAHTLLQQTGARVIGCVLNQQPSGDDSIPYISRISRSSRSPALSVAVPASPAVSPTILPIQSAQEASKVVQHR
ncbi:polysaccharide biosynthesis tyrosine autokinase [Ktedonobacteria bacterium brp13]|nr:polysaccharide biosynthesis tyrosine autokinase [Ktedonobacteria bacterium brp13]